MGNELDKMDSPKQDSSRLWLKSEMLGDFEEAIERIREARIVGFTRCQSYKSLTNKQKLVANQIAQLSTIRDDTKFSTKVFKKPRVNFLKIMKIMPGKQLGGITSQQISDYLAQSITSSPKKFMTMKVWKSGVDKRANGKVWAKPDDETIRLSVGLAGLSSKFGLTTQLKTTLLPKGPDKRAERAYKLKNDFTVEDDSQSYDLIFLSERTRVDESKSDSTRSLKMLCKLKQIGDDLIMVTTVQLIDTYIYPDIAMKKVMRSAVLETAGGLDVHTELWPENS